MLKTIKVKNRKFEHSYIAKATKSSHIIGMKLRYIANGDQPNNVRLRGKVESLE